MDPKNEALLDVCVKKSLGYDPVKARKYSIVECANNEFLDPDYDPFDDLRLRLMFLGLKEQYSLK